MNQSNIITLLTIIKTLKDSCNLNVGNKLLQCNTTKNVAVTINVPDDYAMPYGFTTPSINKILASYKTFKNVSISFTDQNQCTIKDEHGKIKTRFNFSTLETIDSPVNYNREINIDALTASRQGVLQFTLTKDDISTLEKFSKLFDYSYIKLTKNGNVISITPHHSNQSIQEMNSAPIEVECNSDCQDLSVIIANPLQFIHSNANYDCKLNFNLDKVLSGLYNDDYSVLQMKWDKSDELFDDKKFDVSYIAIV